jgi:hypothetical protein
MGTNDYNLATVFSIHDELKSFHISDPELDQILDRIDENERDPRLSEDQEWIDLGDIDNIGNKISFLCEEIHDR